jgi:hypothetical protein
VHELHICIIASKALLNHPNICTRIVISLVLLKHLPLMKSMSFTTRSTQLSITHKVAHENMHRNFKTLKMRLQSHFIGINLWPQKNLWNPLPIDLGSNNNNNENIIFYKKKPMTSLIDYQSLITSRWSFEFSPWSSKKAQSVPHQQAWPSIGIPIKVITLLA